VRLLLHAYPRRWRERYGDEFLALLEDEELTWRVAVNIVGAGLGERLRAVGPPPVRVLWAWSLFVVGGMAFQKTSEQWQAVVPGADHAVPTGAFDTVQAAAAVGSVAVLAAVALALPAYAADFRGGGWQALRRPILVASTATVVAAVALVALALDHDIVAASVFIASSLFSLFAWTHAAARAAGRIQPLRLHEHLAHVVTATMVAMTLAAAVWFASVSRHAPNFVGAAQLTVVSVFMVAGMALGITGELKTLRK
jgi:hypothetical protein